MPMRDAIRPTRREFVGGLTVLTVLAAVSMSRPGDPRSGQAKTIDARPAASSSLAAGPQTMEIAPPQPQRGRQRPAPVDPTVVEALRQIAVSE